MSAITNWQSNLEARKQAIAREERLFNEFAVTLLRAEVAGLSYFTIFTYSDVVSLSLTPRVVRSFNDGEAFEKLDSILAIVGGDPDSVQSWDSPAERSREFSWTSSEGRMYRVRFILADDATCQIVILRTETVETERWVKVSETRPVMGFVCPNGN